MSVKGEQGRLAEIQALDLLRSRGLHLVCRNYRSPHGEIDLVMREQKTIVFVEVRYRKNQNFGGAIESIDQHKQNKIRLTAAHYLQRNHCQKNARFDVVLLSALNDKDKIQWIKSAFE